MPLAADLESALREFAAAGPAELRDNGARVAPALRFHLTTGSLLRYLHRQMEVVRVGLAESWRRGLCVILRQ